MSPDRTPREEASQNPQPRHPSYDPSGDEPAGSSDGHPDRSFAGAEIPSESEQARSRRESMGSRDNSALGPHDQLSGDETDEAR
jgi:hypothetical protein